jgi:hypothetical protein
MRYREQAKQDLQAIITTLNPPLPDTYNLGFPTFGSAGIEELKTFIQALDKRATWARSREDCCLERQATESTTNPAVSVVVVVRPPGC